MLLVNDWMIAKPTTVAPSTPMLEAERIMRQEGFRHLPVVEGDVLVGIISDRDLKEAEASDATSLSVFELNYLLSRLTVADVMTREVITVGPNTRVDQAARIMLGAKISCLPVVDGDRVIGMITLTDLMHALLERLETEEIAAPRSVAS